MFSKVKQKSLSSLIALMAKKANGFKCHAMADSSMLLMFKRYEVAVFILWNV